MFDSEVAPTALLPDRYRSSSAYEASGSGMFALYSFSRLRCLIQSLDT